MRKFTTPTLLITLKRKVGEDECGNPIYEDATDYAFDYLTLTLKQSEIEVDKRVESSEVVDAKFRVRYTQEETGRFATSPAEAIINFWNGSTRVATLIRTIDIEKNLLNEVIE